MSALGQKRTLPTLRDRLELAPSPGEVAMRLLLSIVLAAFAPGAFACNFARPRLVEFDEALSMQGETPPAKPAFAIDAVYRGNVKDPSDSCGDTGVIVLSVPANAETRSLAYTFELVRGEADDLIFFEGAFTGIENEGKIEFVFPWLDGAHAKQEALDLTVRITPYRLSGLKGEPVEIAVRDAGS